MIQHWTEFQGSPNRADKDKPRVTLSPRGVFFLNRKAFEALDTPSAVRLLFDENSHIIGLKPADIKYQNAFPVKQKDKYQNRIINASPFCSHFKIRVERTVLFNEVDIDNEGVMKLELKQTTSIGRGRW